MAQKLSRLPATDGKETSHRDGSLFVREVRVEGLGGPIISFLHFIWDVAAFFSSLPARAEAAHL